MLLALFAGVSACAPVTVTEFAERHHMIVGEIEGDGFQHRVIERSGLSSSGRLHVYIEGDGIPWAGNLPSADPTPRNTLALRLANQDNNDIVYVGRPCYFGLAITRQCEPKYWTSHRYADEVVRSMASVIKRVRRPRHTGIILIGHSGGGALAALLESRIEGVVGVITIGANLDIDQWTQSHHYDPLTGSLNPIKQSRDGHIPHLQLVGANDQVVSASSSRAYSRVQPNVEMVVFDEFDHICCWERDWPDILSEFSARLIN